MAYNLPPDGGEFAPGGGFGFPGFGKSFNLDYGAGFGGGPGFFGGGFPGWGGPYVPVTPLGGLWGFKGDLIVPIVAIGVAIFILLLIVLAVKYALAFKLSLLGDVAGAKTGKFLRNAPAPHLEDSSLNSLADIVSAAVYSEGCSRRILCELGAYAREGKQYPSLIRLMELIVPEDYHDSLIVVREAAESNFNCEEKYPCGAGNKTSKADFNPNEIDVTKGKTAGEKSTTFGLPPGSQNATGATLNNKPGSSPKVDATPAPTVFGKFQRAIFQR